MCTVRHCNSQTFGSLSARLIAFSVGTLLISSAINVQSSRASEAESPDGPSSAGHAHHMSEETYDALREKVPLYRDYTNQEIDLSMIMMGPNYEEYVSSPAVSGEVGVLVLAHGYGEKGDRVFKAQLDALAGAFPTAIGFGMSMTQSHHIQAAVDDLSAAGARKIVVIPALSSPWNTQMRQWEYMFGIHDDAGYVETDRISTDAEIVYTETLSDNPLVAEAAAGPCT